MGRYNFSKSSDSKTVNLVLSDELHERIMRLCNITELTMTAICRYLLKRGVGDMEKKLVEMANAEEAKAS